MKRAVVRALVAVVAVAGCLASAASADPAGTFTSTGSLVDGVRQWHPALRLADGRVFVVGGAGGTGGGALATAEVYDPSTGTWTHAATMAVARHLASAHLLPGGKVLVVGGSIDPSTVFASTELWDPAAPGAFTARAALSVPRYRHVGVTLADGRVLAAGGISSGTSPVSSAEVYDPVANAWATVDPMPAARNAAAGVLLEDGTVLVVGGNVGSANGYAGTTTCQRFDPVAGTWTLVGDMGVGRHSHAAVRLLDGRVLVAGGAGVLSTEVYDPDTQAWTGVGSIGSGGDLSTLTLLADGRVLATGGYLGAHLAAAALFDPTTDTWTSLPPMTRTRFAHSATLLTDGRVLLAGGHVSLSSPYWTDTCELFTVTAPDLPPTANAGPDLSVHAGDEVTLDGSASSDDNTPLGDLGFAWSFVSKPAGSTASLAGAATATPSFTADVPGTFVLSLVVEDGLGQTHVDEVVVSSANLAPTVDAGADVATTVGTSVTFNGSVWDPEDDPVTVAWTIVSAPAGSTATLTGAGTLTPSLTPDVAGTYVLGLAASDPWADAEEDYVVVTAALAGPTVEDLLTEASSALMALPTSAFDAPGHKVAFAAQLRTALEELARYRAGDADALVRTAHHVRQLLERTDGFPLRGALDKKGAGKDWIVTSAGQFAVYEPLRDALDALVP